MQVTQEKRPGSRIGLTIVVEADQVKKTYEKTLRNLVQNVQVQGFRKGKAPRQLVLRQVGSQRVTASAMDELMNTAIRDALKSEAISPVSQFEIETSFDELFQSFKTDADFSFSGSVEVYPEVKLGSYQGLELNVTRVDANPAQIDEKLNGWLDQKATLVPVEERPAQLGDVATVDFAGFDENGDPLEGAAAEEFQLDLKTEAFITGFVDGVVGMTLEETREIEAQFPDDYFQEEHAGKKAKFTVTLHDLKEKELPELDDAFVADLTNNEMETVEQLREYLAKQIEQEARQNSSKAMDDAILDAITEQTEIDLPESMIADEETKDISNSLREIQGMMNLSPADVERFLKELPEENVNQLRAKFRPQAEKRLRRSLSLGEVVRQENIQVGSTELSLAVEDMMRGMGTAKIDRRRVESVMQDRLLTTKVITWLRDQNTITWVDADGNPVESPLKDPEPEVSESTVPEAEFETEAIDTEATNTDTIDTTAVAETSSEDEDPLAVAAQVVEELEAENDDSSADSDPD